MIFCELLLFYFIYYFNDFFFLPIIVWKGDRVAPLACHLSKHGTRTKTHACLSPTLMSQNDNIMLPPKQYIYIYTHIYIYIYIYNKIKFYIYSKACLLK
jgi:hypothetical protein